MISCRLVVGAVPRLQAGMVSRPDLIGLEGGGQSRLDFNVPRGSVGPACFGRCPRVCFAATATSNEQPHGSILIHTHKSNLPVNFISLSFFCECLPSHTINFVIVERDDEDLSVWDGPPLIEMCLRRRLSANSAPEPARQAILVATSFTP